jgi:hypothetical protein
MTATVPIAASPSIDQRFAQLIRQFGLTKNSFAISLGKTASVVQHLIDGRNKPGFDLMCKVFEVYPNVSRDWLLLGRGPMLVGSNGSIPSTKEPLRIAPAEADFEPIDLADVALRAPRRPTASRLHPEEIDATLALALAAAVNGPSVVTITAPAADIMEPAAESRAANLAVPPRSVPAAVPATHAAPAMAAAGEAPKARPFRPAARPVPAAEAAPAAAPMSIAQRLAPAQVLAPVAEPAVAPSSPPPASPVGGPEAYVAAAIHAQHLQHQLAMAEMRNQHLLEQQQMLREMLAMARQSMV